MSENLEQIQDIDKYRIEYLAIQEKFDHFVDELRGLFVKHKIDLYNRDTYDGKDEYAGTDVHFIIDGNKIPTITLHETLEEILQDIFDASQGTMYNRPDEDEEITFA